MKQKEEKGASAQQEFKMKVTVGNTVGITLSAIPYSPIKVESTFLVEKEFEGDDLDSVTKELAEKVEKVLYSDLERKMEEVFKKQKELKKKIEGIL